MSPCLSLNCAFCMTQQRVDMRWQGWLMWCSSVESWVWKSSDLVHEQAEDPGDDEALARGPEEEKEESPRNPLRNLSQTPTESSCAAFAKHQLLQVRTKLQIACMPTSRWRLVFSQRILDMALMESPRVGCCSRPRNGRSSALPPQTAQHVEP